MIRKLVERNTPTEIICSSHPGEQVTLFDQTRRKLLCPKCPSVGQSIPLTRDIVIKCLVEMNHVAERKLNEILEAKRVFEGYLDDQEACSSEQMLKALISMHDFVGDGKDIFLRSNLTESMNKGILE